MIWEYYFFGTPLQKIKDKQYFEKYQSDSNTIYLIGIEFNPNGKNIEHFDWEKLA